MITTTKTELMDAGALSRPEKAANPLANAWKALVPIVAGAAVLVLPVPEGLTPNAWYYFALFVAVIIALILEPIPAAAVGVIGVTAAAVSLLVTPKPADAVKWRCRDFRMGRCGSSSSPSCSRSVMKRPGWDVASRLIW